MTDDMDIIAIENEPDITLGEHLILDFNECLAVDNTGRSILTNVKEIEKMLLEAAKVGRMTYMSHKMVEYPPNGSVSGVIIVAESHISIHTWDEYYYAMVDINSCGSFEGVKSAAKYIMEFLKSGYPKITRVRRGVYRRKYFKKKLRT